MKKLLSILISACIMFTGTYVLAEDEVNIYVTVTDIRDVENPFNILVPRRELTVSDFDIEAKYGKDGITFTGIECADGVTYMHAIVALHEELYGEDLVTQKLALNEDGKTSWFMGTSVDSVMYQNGEDIFTLPQNVLINNGDEINICLYNVGDEQRVATFTTSKIQAAAVGEEITLNLYEHLESPQKKTPIGGQVITDNDGVYITDGDGNLIKTKANGEFTVSFDKPGTYQISILPEINYFFKDIDSSGQVLSGYSLEEGQGEDLVDMPEEGTVYKTADLRELQSQGVTIEALDIYDAYLVETGAEENSNFVFFEWGDNTNEVEDEAGTVAITYSTWSLRRIYGQSEQGEAYPQITYTMPFCTIFVTNELTIKSIEFGRNGDNGNDCIWVKFVNADIYEEGAEVIISAYDENNTYIGMQRRTISNEMHFDFATGAAYYKVMIWSSLSDMKPIFISTECR